MPAEEGDSPTLTESGGPDAALRLWEECDGQDDCCEDEQRYRYRDGAFDGSGGEAGEDLLQSGPDLIAMSYAQTQQARPR